MPALAVRNLCMNKRTTAFKTLLTKYKKLETEHKALKAERESQAGDNAQVAELLKRVVEVQDEKKLPGCWRRSRLRPRRTRPR